MFGPCAEFDPPAPRPHRGRSRGACPRPQAIPPRRGGPSRSSGSAETRSRRRAAKSDQRDAVAPNVAVGEQQFDRALHFRQPLHCRRSRSVENEDRRCAAPLTIAHNAEIVRLDLQSIPRLHPDFRRRERAAMARPRATLRKAQSAFFARTRARRGRASAQFGDWEARRIFPRSTIFVAARRRPRCAPADRAEWPPSRRPAPDPRDRAGVVLRLVGVRGFLRVVRRRRGLRLRFRLGFIIFLSRHSRRSRRKNQTRRQRDVVILDATPPRERRALARPAARTGARATRRPPSEPPRRPAPRQPKPPPRRRRASRGPRQNHPRNRPRPRCPGTRRRQVDPIAHAIEQGLGRALVVALAFVQGDDAEPRRHFHREPVARQSDDAPVERRGDPRGDPRAALGHRQHQHAAIRLCDNPGFGDRSAGAQRRCYVKPAKQSVVGDVGRRTTQRCAGGSASTRRPSQASRTGPGPARTMTPFPTRIDGEQRPRRGSRAARALQPSLGALMRQTSPARARSTRTAEPASSSGLRRRRWLSAIGATRRSCASPTSPCLPGSRAPAPRE